MVLCASTCQCKPVVPASASTSSSEHSPSLLVHNTISKVDNNIFIATLTGPVDAEQCEYAGSVPDASPITSLSVAWACEPVQNNVITIPQYVYKMQPVNAREWNKYQSRCGCELVLYSIPFLRFEASSATWTLAVHRVPVGTTCSNIEGPLCRELRGLEENAI